ncbi:uncharacterized protein LOC143020242 isoform X2 [Oratosquilla oratoria]|uniref:uncharacterized protein LOC143020242 isoform X2 n=1 Tax=Oratosquilla oratoria TaxID=337810 RepID=UPI003F75ACAB
MAPSPCPTVSIRSLVVVTMATVLLTLTTPCDASCRTDSVLDIRKWRNMEWDICDFQDSTNTSCLCPPNDYEGKNDGVDCRKVHTAGIILECLMVPSNYSKLDLSGTGIIHLTPYVFYGVDHLTKLDLAKNFITNISDRVFQYCTSLEELRLSNNYLEILQPQALAGLTKLTSLDLSYNQLTELPDSLLQDSPELKVLSLAFNPALSLSPEFFAALTSLTSLDLTSTGLGDVPGHMFQHNTRLLSLKLGHNGMTEVPSDALRNVASTLNELELSANPIQVLDKDSFPQLKELRKLTLEQMMKLSKIEEFAFHDLENLETIVLRYLPEIRDIDEKAFRRMVNGSHIPVQDLTFSFTRLEYLPEDLLDWEGLKYVHIEYHRWRCNCRMSWTVGSVLAKKLKHSFRCSYPDVLRGRMINSIPSTDLMCKTTPLAQHGSLWWMVALVVMAVTVSLLVVFILARRRQREIQKIPCYSVVRNKDEITVIDDTESDERDVEV